MSILGALVPARVERTVNECRWTPEANARGHVESYFLRLNDPDCPRALWLKATILAPRRGPPESETWVIWFDGEQRRTWAHRATRPLAESTFPTRASGHVDVSGATFDLGPAGGSRGELTRGGERCRWDLAWTRRPGPVGEPLSIFPHPFMVNGPFPKSKLLTPFPQLDVTGTIECAGERVDVTRWSGMQGHNWGQEHALEYAWGQCVFPGADGAPDAMVEGFSGRIKLAGQRSPRMSAVVVRRGSQTWRFDRVFDFWRQDAAIDDFQWSVRLEGPDGAVRLDMNAAGRPIACLGYRNPNGRLSYCFNSKLAETTLSVEPRAGAPFVLRSAHGGALEFLRNEPDGRFPDVI